MILPLDAFGLDPDGTSHDGIIIANALDWLTGRV